VVAMLAAIDCRFEIGDLCEAGEDARRGDGNRPAMRDPEGLAARLAFQNKTGMCKKSKG